MAGDVFSSAAEAASSRRQNFARLKPCASTVLQKFRRNKSPVVSGGQWPVVSSEGEAQHPRPSRTPARTGKPEKARCTAAEAASSRRQNFARLKPCASTVLQASAKQVASGQWWSVASSEGEAQHPRPSRTPARTGKPEKARCTAAKAASSRRQNFARLKPCASTVLQSFRKTSGQWSVVSGRNKWSVASAEGEGQHPRPSQTPARTGHPPARDYLAGLWISTVVQVLSAAWQRFSSGQSTHLGERAMHRRRPCQMT